MVVHINIGLDRVDTSFNVKPLVVFIRHVDSDSEAGVERSATREGSAKILFGTVPFFRVNSSFSAILLHFRRRILRRNAAKPGSQQL